MHHEISRTELSALLDELDSLRTALGLPTSLDQPLPKRDLQQSHLRLNSQEEQYNQLLDRIASLSPGPFSDPLDAFPHEIWEKIIFEVASEIYAPSTEESPQTLNVDYILPLTLVSVRWRDAIIANPRFWNHFMLDPEAEDLEAKLASSSILSRGLYITVFIYEEENSTTLWDVLGHYIVSQRSRIRCLLLGPYVNLDTVFESIGEAPLLQVLRTDKNGAPSPIGLNFFQSAKHLRSIIGEMSFPGDSLRFLSSEEIRTINVVDASEDTVTHLKHMKSLEHVNFTEIFEDHPYKGEIALLPWKSLSFSGHIDGVIRHVLRSSAASLVDLEATVDWPDIQKLLLLCNYMPQLLSLTIVVYQQQPPTSIQAKEVKFQRLDLFPSNIRKLHLQINVPSLSPNYNANFNILFTNLELMAPNVQHLWCSAPAYKSFLKYACSLQSLKSVTAPFLIRTPLSSPKPNSIGILKTDHLFIHDAAIFDYIRMEGIISLTLMGHSELWPSLHEHARSKEWRNLTKMSLQATATNWEGISLPHLTTVDFGGTLGRDQLTHGLTALCQEIAISPQNFPSLEKLTSNGFPEWDILFIMLERRNVFVPSDRRKDISKIKCLRFHAQLPISVLKPLTALLGGRLTPRPSNHQLSLAGIAETLLDPNMYVFQFSILVIMLNLS